MATDGVTLVWRVPPERLALGVGNYVERLLSAVYDLAQFFAAQIETQAKAGAKWVDRTGHARQGLTARAFKTATSVVLYLWHSVFYGIFLEVKQAGRLAIILPTLEKNYGPYMQAIQGLLR